ncbi:MAG: hypothetical protein ACPG77_14055, partial [Nannocystaceae bacterium]
SEPIEGSERLQARLKSCLCNKNGEVEVGVKLGSGGEQDRLLEVWARAPVLPETAATCLRHQLYGFRLDRRRASPETLQFELRCEAS